MSVPSRQAKEPIPENAQDLYAMVALRGFYDAGLPNKVPSIPTFLAKSAIEVDKYITKTFPQEIPSQLRPETLQRAFSELSPDAQIRNDLLPLSVWVMFGRPVGCLTERPTTRTMKIAWIQKTKADQYGNTLKLAPPSGDGTSAFDAVLLSLTALKVGLRRIDVLPKDDDNHTRTQRAARQFLEKPFPSGTFSTYAIEERRNEVVDAYHHKKDIGTRPLVDVASLLNEIGVLYASMQCCTIRRVACYECGKIRDDNGKEVGNDGGRSKPVAYPSRVVLEPSPDATRIALACGLVGEGELIDVGTELSTVFHPDPTDWELFNCPCRENEGFGHMPLRSWDLVGGYLPPFLFFSPSTDNLWMDDTFRGRADILYCREENGVAMPIEESYQLCQVFCLKDGRWTLYVRIEDSHWVFFDPEARTRMKKLEGKKVEDIWQKVRRQQSDEGSSIAGGKVLLVFAHTEAASGYIDLPPAGLASK